MRPVFCLGQNEWARGPWYKNTSWIRDLPHDWRRTKVPPPVGTKWRQFERTVLETPSSENDWTPSWRESIALTPLVWHPARCCRCRNPADWIGVTRMSMNGWRTAPILTWPDEDSMAEPSTWPLVNVSESMATTIRMAFRKPESNVVGKGAYKPD